MRSTAARLVNIAVAAVFGTALALTGASGAQADDATPSTGGSATTTTTTVTVKSSTSVRAENFPWG